jgi:hypothetical protein
MSSQQAAAENGDEAVQVRVATFTQLCGGELPFAVDTYQRGFVWNGEKVAQLADDLLEYQQQPEPKPPYYMGTLLLHVSPQRRRRFVIDGQQRLTALFVLQHLLTGEPPQACQMNYTPTSARRIQGAFATFSVRRADLRREIFDRICFTTISVDSVDLAFAFFDTQSNRGVRLHATDLLKAYHLRVVDGAGGRREQLQELCASGWEAVQQGAAVLSADGEFTASLFSRFLWRARRWRGNSAVPADHEGVLREFQRDTWLAPEAAAVPLYAARNNRRAAALVIREDGGPEMRMDPMAPDGQPHDMPFTLRQPIHRGLGLFLYTEKYAALLRWLMTGPPPSPQVARAREIHDHLVMANSGFLREIYVLSLLAYVDRFGDELLFEFALWLEHAIGAIRIEKASVRKEAAQNFFAKPSANLLDIISGAFRPEQVIRHMQASPGFSERFRAEEIRVTAGGVQARYKRAVLKYFGKSGDSLADKERWIAEKLKEEA